MSSDLSSFTPASAPILQASTSAKTKSSPAVARSRSGIATSTEGSALTSKGSPRQSASTKSAAQFHSQGSRLSTGEKAGIGVGIAVGVLLVLVLGFILLRRRKKQRTGANQTEGPQRAQSHRLYVESKAELPSNGKLKTDGVASAELPGREPQELAANEAPREPQELAENRESPPMPLASKPRLDSPGRDGDPQELA